MAVSLSKGVYIVSGKRTPFGKIGGMFRDLPAEDLFAIAAAAAFIAGGVSPEMVDTVNIGQISSLSKTPMSARHGALKAKIPQDKPVLSLNKLSGSGLHAIIVSAQEILTNSAQISLAGGMESISSVPFLVRNARFGVPLGSELVLEDWLHKSNYDSYCRMQLTQMGDLLANVYKLSRQELDEFALRSHMRWRAAHEKGLFDAELTPVTIKQKGQEVSVMTDESPRSDISIESLSKLQPMHSGGVTTAATVCGMNDGAGAMIITNEYALHQHNLTPLARVAGWSNVGVEPELMGIGPVRAVKLLLDTAGLTVKDIDLFEVHETFASQALACARELRIADDRLNVNGGTLATGHPSGASGVRIASQLIHELIRRKLRRGVATACLSGGQGIALLLEVP